MTEHSAPESAATPPADAIDLAAEPDFHIGALHVQPSLRRVATAARTDSVEPRVMQALVALARARGAVVSRDALIERCWAGRIVGEDAINRCIAKVRALADLTQPPAFSIETVPRVGYLLKPLARPVQPRAGVPPSPPPPPHDVPPPPSSPAAAPPQAASPLDHRAPAPLATRAMADDAASPDPAVPRRGLWREAGIAAFVIVVAIAGTFVAFQPASPVARPSASSAPFDPPPHSIAVLPFANLSGDPGQDYLADDLSEALIDTLSRINDLQVTAQTSSFSFKGRAATIGDIARRLNVGAVAEGTLRRQGDRLRIDAHLSDARTGFTIWSRSYDRTAGDLLRLQDEIAGDVAEALQVKLTDATGLSLGGTANPQAYDAYLRGEQHYRTVGDMGDAYTAFRDAVALDPNFAIAQGALAAAFFFGGGWAPDEKAYRVLEAEARHAADRAVELAPGLGRLHAQRAIVLRDSLTDLAAAWAEAVRARALSPGDAEVQRIYALIARAVGRPDEAVRGARRAVELDPLRVDTWWALGRALECARKFDAALDAFHRAIAVAGHPIGQPYLLVPFTLIEQGKYAAALQACPDETDWTGLQCRAIAWHALGRRQDAEAEMTKLQAAMGDQGAYQFAQTYAQWNEPARALQWLTKARALNDAGLMDLKCDALLDPIRDQPGFGDVEKTMHYPPPDR